MKLKIIEFKTAKLAKEVGFDIEVKEFYTPYVTYTQSLEPSDQCKHLHSSKEELCEYFNGYYNWNELEDNTWVVLKDAFNWVDDDGYKVLCSAPEQALLQQWLREVHEIVVTVNLLKNRWNVSVVNGIKIATHAYASPVYDTYEDALEDGLYQGLKMIKDENNR